MQRSVHSLPVPANGEDNRQAFWDEMMRIAARGMDKPDSLTLPEVQTICRLAVLGMTRRDKPRRT